MLENPGRTSWRLRYVLEHMMAFGWLIGFLCHSTIIAERVTYSLLMTKDELLTVDELAEKLKVPKQTLYAWRSKGVGPPGFLVGRHVRYRLVDVEEWLDARRDADSRRQPADW
jgi:excisionase family DNA binding protein